MITTLRPTWKSGFARNVGESANPHLWGFSGAWVPALGVTGNTLFDVSGRRNHGILTNMDPATDWIIDEGGYALSYDGANDHIDMGDVLGFERTDPFSIVIAVKSATATFTGVHGLIAKQAVTSPFTGWGIHIRGDFAGDPYRFELINDGTAIIDISVDFPRPANTERHHIVTTYNGSSLASGVKGYINGRSETGVVLHDTLTAGILTSRSLQIAARDAATFFPGKVYEVYIYPRVLSPVEARQLYIDPLAPFRLRDRFAGIGITPPPSGNRIMGSLAGYGGLAGIGGIAGQKGGIAG